MTLGLFTLGCSSKHADVEGTIWQSVGRTSEGEYGGNDTMEIEFLQDHKAEFRLRLLRVNTQALIQDQAIN